MSYIYFCFAIDHDMTSKLVKIGGTSDYESRSAEHLTTSSCYVIVYSTPVLDTFKQVEAAIKKDHSLSRHYDDNMMQNIVKTHQLKLVSICIPAKLQEKFSFIDKHISKMIGSKEDIDGPGICIETMTCQYGTISLDDTCAMLDVVDVYLREHFHVDYPEGVSATELLVRVNDFISARCTGTDKGFKSYSSLCDYVLAFGDKKVFNRSKMKGVWWYYRTSK